MDKILRKRLLIEGLVGDKERLYLQNTFFYHWVNTQAELLIHFTDQAAELSTKLRQEFLDDMNKVHVKTKDA